MAFLPPEQENQNAPQGQTTANPMAGGAPQTGGSAGTGAGASKAGGAPNTGSPNQFGSSASKLGDYLSANAPQVQTQANGVAGSLNNQYGQVGTDVSNAANQFGQQVQSGYAAPNQSLVDQAANNTSQFVQNPNNVAGFQAQYNDTYTGPQSFESTTPYASIQNEVNTAVQNAGTFNTPTGLQNYFAQNSGPNQTAATNTLDSLLVQGNPNAQQTVTNAANQFSNLTPQLANSTTAADAQVQSAQQAAQNAQSYAQNAINGSNGTLTNLNNNVNATTAQDIAAAQAQNAGVLQDVTSGSLSPATLQALGLTGDQSTALWQANNQANLPHYETGNNFGAATQQQNLSNMSQYLQQQDPTQYINAANVATPQQYSEASAIQQLLGGSLPQGSVLNPAQANLAGTAPTDLNQFNYNAALSNAQNVGSGAISNAQAQANALTQAADQAHAASMHGGVLNTIKNAVTEPGKSLVDLNPVQALQYAMKGETATGDNPLPTKAELNKIS